MLRQRPGYPSANRTKKGSEYVSKEQYSDPFFCPGTSAFDQDIYVSTRPDTASPWPPPKRIDHPAINTPASETRASLSADGTRLYFGRKLNVDDPGDVQVSTRTKITGGR